MTYNFCYNNQEHILHADIGNLAFAGDMRPEDKEEKIRLFCSGAMLLAKDMCSEFSSSVSPVAVADAFLTSFQTAQAMTAISAERKKPLVISKIIGEIVSNHELGTPSQNDSRLLHSAVCAGVSAAVEWTLAVENKNYDTMESMTKKRKRETLKRGLGLSQSEYFGLKDVSKDYFSRTFFNIARNKTISSGVILQERTEERRSTSAMRDNLKNAHPGAKKGFVDISTCIALASSLLCTVFLSPTDTWKEKYLAEETLVPCIERYEPVGNDSVERFSKILGEKSGGRLNGKEKEVFWEMFTANTKEIENAKAENSLDAPFGTNNGKTADETRPDGIPGLLI